MVAIHSAIRDLGGLDSSSASFSWGAANLRTASTLPSLRASRNHDKKKKKHGFSRILPYLLSRLNETLGCNSNRINECLRMNLCKLHQQIVNQSAHNGHRRMNASEQLGNHNNPSVQRRL